MHRPFIGAIGTVLVAGLAVTTAQAEGNLASQPTYLETSIDGANETWTGDDFQLEVGKYYIWEITSDGVAETLIRSPELFRNSWINQIVINDKEIHTSGSLYGVEYDGAGTIAISFLPVRPGEYTFEAPGFEKLTGTFHVTGESLTGGATPIELNIDTGALAYSQTEIPLETGKAYRLDVTSDGLEELGVQAPELWRNAWINQLVIDDLEVKLDGAFYAVEYDDEGTISISFIPIRPGNYAFYSAGYEEAGLIGNFSVR